MAPADFLSDAESDARHRRVAVVPTAVATGLVAASGALASAAADYLNRYGPSGNHPQPWSYTGNGALDVFVYAPLAVFVGWSVLAVRQRGYRSEIALTTGITALVLGTITGIANEIGVIGQLPDLSWARSLYGIVANAGLALLAFVAGLGLAVRFTEQQRRSVITSILLALITIATGVTFSLMDTWPSFSIVQILLVGCTVTGPLLVGTPQGGARHRIQRHVFTVVGYGLVPIAFIGGFALESALRGLFSG